MKILTGKYIKIFFLAAAILLLYKVLFDFESLTGTFSLIMGIIQPFCLGFVLAYCLNIPVTWLEQKILRLKLKPQVPKKRKRVVAGEVADVTPRPHLIHRLARPLSVLTTLAAFAGFLVFGFMTIIPMITANMRQLFDALPGYLQNGYNFLMSLPIVDELGLNEYLATVNPTELLAFLPEIDIIAITSGVFSGVVATFLTIVATLYFLVEYNNVRGFIKRFVLAHSPRRQRPILKYVRLADSSFRKFITCQTIDALILGTLAMIELTIIGSQYAVTLGLLLGIANMIPYFGAIIASIFSVLIIWAADGVTTAVIAAIVLLATQQFDGNFILPKLLGSSFKLSPILIIIAITIGGSVAGIFGVIFSVPIVNVIKSIVEEYIQTKEQQRLSDEPVGDSAP